MSTSTPLEQEDIEHLIRQPEHRRHETPLLFLHGAWHGAWCWATFLDTFASLGYEAHAISLPGHGASSLARGHIDRYTFDDFVQCLESAIESITPRPVVVAHSMGGAILQTYLQEHHLPAAVLLASIPAKGFMAGFVRVARMYPWQAVKAGRDGYALVETPEIASRFFLSSPTQIDVEQFHRHLVRESAPGSKRILSVVLRHPEKVTTPVLVIAAGKDFLISVAEERQTADLLRAKFVVIEDAPHDLMFEPGWQQAVDSIHAWLADEIKLP